MDEKSGEKKHLGFIIFAQPDHKKGTLKGKSHLVKVQKKNLKCKQTLEKKKHNYKQIYTLWPLHPKPNYLHKPNSVCLRVKILSGSQDKNQIEPAFSMKQHWFLTKVE